MSQPHSPAVSPAVSPAITPAVSDVAISDPALVGPPRSPTDRFMRKLLRLPVDGPKASANEARDGTGNDLGIEGVKGLLERAAGTRPAVREWAEAMLDGVREHRGGAAEDDTLVVVVYRPSVVAPTTSGARRIGGASETHR